MCTFRAIRPVVVTARTGKNAYQICIVKKKNAACVSVRRFQQEYAYGWVCNAPCLSQCEAAHVAAGCLAWALFGAAAVDRIGVSESSTTLSITNNQATGAPTGCTAVVTVH